MRIVRFRGGDDKVMLGEDLGDGTARILFDAVGVLGPDDADDAIRETLRGKRALVADDDEGIRRTIELALEKFSCTCTTCRDGKEAMEALAADEIDLVISDIVMPVHDGYEVFAAAKSRRPELPVLLITGFGYDPSHTLLRAMREGLDAVLYKPFSPRELVERIAGALREADDGHPGCLVRSLETERVGSPLAPLAPTEIVCIGRNYRSGPDDAAPAHELLEVFLKPISSVQDPGGPIRIPRIPGVDPQVAVEGELGIVIRETTSRVPPERALDAVLGFVPVNDVTARHWQTASPPNAWMRGKGFDTFCPIGPAIVTRDEIGDPNDLEIICRINDRVVSQASTRSMLRPVEQIISELSMHMTLGPGTLILTGGPPAHASPIVGSGDDVSVEIEGVGVLRNYVVETHDD